MDNHTQLYTKEKRSRPERPDTHKQNGRRKGVFSFEGRIAYVARDWAMEVDKEKRSRPERPDTHKQNGRRKGVFSFEGRIAYVARDWAMELDKEKRRRFPGW